MKKLILLLIPFLFILPSAQAEDDAHTLLLTGDVMLGRNINQRLKGKSPSFVWGNLLSTLKKANTTIINLEFALTAHDQKWDARKAFNFKADPSVVGHLTAAGIDYVSLANNHVMDYGSEGLLETMAHLSRKGILFAGAGQSLDEAQNYRMIDQDGYKMAVISLTDDMAEWRAGSGTPGIFQAPIEPETLAIVKRRAHMAKELGAQLVILSLHWGGNWKDTPPSSFRTFAHAALDSGVDVIHGHSAHVIQGVELYRGKPIFYGMGDVVDDYELKPGLRNDLGYMARLEVDKTRIAQVKTIELIPTRIQQFRGGLAQGTDWKVAAQKLTELSAAFGTTVENKKGKLLVKLPLEDNLKITHH